ncbi:MAG: response regulator [Gammaproteobacteria bacterium]
MISMLLQHGALAISGAAGATAPIAGLVLVLLGASAVISLSYSQWTTVRTALVITFYWTVALAMVTIWVPAHLPTWPELVAFDGAVWLVPLFVHAVREAKFRRDVHGLPIPTFVYREGAQGSCQVTAMNDLAREHFGDHVIELMGRASEAVGEGWIHTTLARDDRDEQVAMNVKRVSQRTRLVMILEQTTLETRINELERVIDAVSEARWEWNLATGESTVVGDGVRYLGYEGDDLQGSPSVWEKFIHPDDYDEALRRTAEYLSGKRRTYRAEYRVLRKDGTYRWVLSRGEVVEHNDEGNPVRLAGTFTDITELKEATADRDRLQVQLRHAQKLNALGQLTGGIAHDFNNILASVLGHAELALIESRAMGSSQITGYLEEIQQAAARARNLISQMLAFSRGIKSGEETIAVAPLMSESIKLLRPVLPATVEIQTDIDDATPDIRIDPVQLQQVVLNLCINARDAMGEMGVLTLAVKTRHLDGENCASCMAPIFGDFVEISVEDDGQGIEGEHLGYIFDPFFSTKDVGKGSGLGLSVVHGIVHERRGHIILESHVGQGSRFRLLFPVAEGRVSVHQPEAKVTSIRQGIGEHILLVDDEQSVANFLRVLLERRGYKVTVCTKSREALRMFQENPAEFDMVITDQTMPHMTGVELADEMMAVRPDVPVIICSGYSEFVNEESAIEMGFRGFLEKPINSDKLFAMLDGIIDHRVAS